jgi:soluble lytic murein transglycosylase
VQVIWTGDCEAQTLGLNLSLAQLNQIQANPLNYLWSAPKPMMRLCVFNFCIGRLAIVI